MIILRRLITLVVLTVGTAAGAAHADRVALVIGIDEYRDRNHINALGGAMADAKAVADILRDAAGFDRVFLMTRDGGEAPDRNNILFRLGEIKKALKPGDTFLLFYAGHGMEIEGATYLLPLDVDGRNNVSLRESSLPIVVVSRELSDITLSHFIGIYDMCRTDPRQSNRAITRQNPMTAPMSRNLIVPATVNGTGPRTAITITACSPDQRSWEWVDKGRGYFSYYLEQGLKGDAANSEGTIRIKDLIEYLQRTVPSAVAAHLGGSAPDTQVPWAKASNPAAFDFVLATGRTHAGKTSSEGKTNNVEDAQYFAADTRSRELYRQGRLDAAIERAEEALTYRPLFAYAHSWMGYLYLNVKNYVKAEASLKKAAEMDPKAADTFYSLGLLYHRLHDTAKAEEMYRASIRLDGNAHYALYSLGRLMSDIHSDGKQAEGLYNRALAIKETWLPHIGLGNVFFARKDYVEAEKQYRTALDLVAEGSDYARGNVLYHLGRIYLEDDSKQDLDEAERLFKESRRLNPADPFPVGGLGSIMYRKGDYVAAERAFRAACDMDGCDSLTRANLALTLYRLGRVEEAREEATKAMDSGLRGHMVFDLLGMKRGVQK